MPVVGIAAVKITIVRARGRHLAEGFAPQLAQTGFNGTEMMWRQEDCRDRILLKEEVLI
jgi:hypothetical protein